MKREPEAALASLAKPMKRVTEAEISGRMTKLMNASAAAGFGESAGITRLSM